MTAEDVFCTWIHLWGTDNFINGNLQIRAEEPVAKEGMPWQAKFLLKCSAGSWSLRLSHNNYLLSPLNVSFSCSAAVLTAVLPPESAPHSTRAVWASGEPEICPVQQLISSATEFRTYIRSMGAPVSKSILNLPRLLKCSKAAPPWPDRCVTHTGQTRSTPFPQPCLLLNNCWVKWVIKASPKNPDS